MSTPIAGGVREKLVGQREKDGDTRCAVVGAGKRIGAREGVRRLLGDRARVPVRGQEDPSSPLA